MNGIRPISGTKFELPDALDLAHVLKAVADPARLQIIHVLNAGEMTVLDVRMALGDRLTQPTVSYHLKELRMAGLVRTRSEGVHRWWALNRYALNAVLDLVRPGGVR